MKRNKVLLFALFCWMCTGEVSAQTIGEKYDNFKEFLQNEYNIEYSMTSSLLAQRTSPNGKNNSVQAFLAPNITWTNFDNEYGKGSLNFAYNIIRYNNHDALLIGGNSGMATPINDFPNKQNEFVELYYSYQLGGSWDWLTVNVGQFPIYNFDGTEYSANQQASFVNYALSQNGSSSYATAGFGAFFEIAPTKDWSFILGLQNGTDVDASSLAINHFSENHYTTFGSIAYSPYITDLGKSTFSVLLYNQPWVDEQKETTNGFSFNMSQDIGEKYNVFARINGTSGSVEPIRQSWVLGGVYKDPFNRNKLDAIGLAYAYNKIDETEEDDDLSNTAEQIIEAYWAIGIGDMLTITPDIQLYINPALNDSSNYGVVTSIRATVFF